MPITFTNTSESNGESGVKVLVYSLSGMGKTMMCATAPNPLIISNESGLLSLSKRNIEKIYGVDTPGISYSIPVMKVDDIQSLFQAYEWCKGSAEAQQFQTICLDSLSEMGETVLANAKRTVKDPRQAYGDLIEQTERLVRNFRDLAGKNVYFSAKMEPMKDEFTGLIKYTLAMPGAKLAHKLPYFFDEVFRLGIGQDPADPNKKFRYLQTQPDMQFEAKDRSGALAPIEYPHLGAIFNKIAGAV